MPLMTVYICDFCLAETKFPSEWSKLTPAKYEPSGPNSNTGIAVILCIDCKFLLLRETISARKSNAKILTEAK